jgi:hypothetical protein
LFFGQVALAELFFGVGQVLQALRRLPLFAGSAQGFAGLCGDGVVDVAQAGEA